MLQGVDPYRSDSTSTPPPRSSARAARAAAGSTVFGSSLAPTSNASSWHGRRGITCWAAAISARPISSWVSRRMPAAGAGASWRRTEAVVMGGEGGSPGQALQDSVQPVARRSLELAMEGEYLVAAGPVVLGQPLGQVHRAMPATGAADGNGQVALVFTLEARQPRVQETSNVSQVLYYRLLPAQILADRRVLPRKRAQTRVPVRVGQAACVEHEVRIGRDAAFVGKRFEQQREPR